MSVSDGAGLSSLRKMLWSLAVLPGLAAGCAGDGIRAGLRMEPPAKTGTTATTQKADPAKALATVEERLDRKTCWTLQSALGQLSADEKKALVPYLEKQIPTLKDDLTLPSSMTVLRGVAILRELAPARAPLYKEIAERHFNGVLAYAKEMQSKPLVEAHAGPLAQRAPVGSVLLLSTAALSLTTNTSSPATLTARVNDLDCTQRVLHRVLSVCDPSMRNDCLRMIRGIDATLLSFPPEKLREIVGGDLDAERTIASERRKNERKGMLLVAPDSKDYGKEIREIAGLIGKDATHWKRSADGIQYQSTIDRAGSGRSWWIELDRSFDENQKERVALTLRSAADEHILVKASAAAFMEKLEAGKIEELATTAIERREGERRHEALLRAYDLPKDGQLHLLRLFPSSFDRVISSDIASSALFGGALRERYGARMQLPHLAFEDDPVAEARRYIAEQHKRGVTGATYLIDLSAHGYEDGWAYSKKILPASLLQLAAEFKDDRFVILTLACHNAGTESVVPQAVAADSRLKSQLSFFVQTKPGIVNEVACFNATGSDTLSTIKFRSTLYQNLLIKALLDPTVPTFGEAVWRADLGVKEISSFDPSSFIDGQLISRREADKGSPLDKERLPIHALGREQREA